MAPHSSAVRKVVIAIIGALTLCLGTAHADRGSAKARVFAKVVPSHPEESKYQLRGNSNFQFKSHEAPQWPAYVQTYVADQFKVRPDRIKVQRFGSGKSGDLVFGVTLDGKNLGVLKVYRDPAGASGDARILKVVNQARLSRYKPPREKGGIPNVSIDNNLASALFTEQVPGRSIESLIQHTPKGSERESHMALLDETMRSSATMYWELHQSMASGGKMDHQRKQNEVNMILAKLDAVRALNNEKRFMSPEQLSKIEAKLRNEIAPRFIASNVPATAFHGDAHVGNVVVDDNLNARPIDVTAMKWSLDSNGKGTGAAAVDVGQFIARLYEKSEGALSMDEVRRLKSSFLSEYYKHSKTPQSMMEPAVLLYAVESQLARLQFGIGDSRGAVATISDLLGLGT